MIYYFKLILVEFKYGKKYKYSEKRAQIEGNSNWQNNLNYFKELVSKISVVIDNYNVLEDRYKNLSNLNKKVYLSFIKKEHYQL